MKDLKQSVCVGGGGGGGGEGKKRRGGGGRTTEPSSLHTETVGNISLLPERQPNPIFGPQC